MLSVKNLDVSYQKDKKILESVSFELKEAGLVGLIGPNGAGKSTLIKAILGLIPSQGQVDLSSKKIAYLEQRSQLDHNFPITVKECISLGRYQGRLPFGYLTKEDWQKVSQALEEVSLTDFANAALSELSGGQFQRTLLARCLVQEADIIILDEPFVGVDALSEKIIVELLRLMKANGKLILIVHHDLSKVRNYFDQLIILNKELVAYGPVETNFTVDNLKRAFGNLVFLGEV